MINESARRLQALRVQSKRIIEPMVISDKKSYTTYGET